MGRKCPSRCLCAGCTPHPAPPLPVDSSLQWLFSPGLSFLCVSVWLPCVSGNMSSVHWSQDEPLPAGTGVCDVLPALKSLPAAFAKVGCNSRIHFSSEGCVDFVCDH